MGGNEVKGHCEEVLEALKQHGSSVSGSTLSEICQTLGLARMRGNNFHNAVKVLRRQNELNFHQGVKIADKREETFITLSLPQSQS